MNGPIVFAFVIATASAARLVHLDYEWEQWKNEHGKTYFDEKEEDVRRNIWEESMKFVDLHNHEARLGKHTFTVKMNKFADLRTEEFALTFLGGNKQSQTATACRNASIYVANSNYGPLAESVDWRRQGYVTPVKDQGTCKSCWAFSTTGAIEGAHFRKTGQLVSLSEQNLMDCSRPEGDFSCEGGFMDYAFEYVIKNGGIDTEATYPYEARDENVCKYKKSTRGASISACVDVTPKGDENALKKAVGTVGPVSIGIDASRTSFQLYHQGIYSDPSCSSTHLNHGVLAVGYGTQNGNEYWIVKNSWGKTWGMEGYIWMSRNQQNHCGVASAATYPTA